MTMRTHRNLLLGAALGAVGLLFAANDAAAQKKGGALVYANVSAVGTMDPHVAAAVVDLEAIHHVYEGLVAMSENYSAVPMLAAKVEISSDARTFTFTLRKGVKFSNGKEMTAADAVATFERYKRVSPNSVIMGDIASMETPDPYTFVVKLNKPNAFFVEILKTPSYAVSIIPEELKDKPARELDIVGTGPYQVSEWQRDSHLVLKRHEGYVANTSAAGPDGYAGRRTAYLDTIRYNAVPEANSRIAALQSGGADFITAIPPDIAKRLDGRPGLSVLKVLPFCKQTFITHAKNAPTDNKLIRKAIGALVDVDELVAASGQIADRNHSLMFRGGAYISDVGLPFYDIKSVAKAKALLKEAGYGGQKIVLETNANYPYMRDYMLVLSEAAKAAGMNIELKMVDWTTNVADMSKGTGGWNVTTTGFCSGPLLGPQQWRGLLAFSQNQDDQTIIDGYTKMFGSTDPAQRKAAWLDIETYVLDNAFMIPVADHAELRGHNDKFVNIKPYYMQRFWDVWVK